MIYFLIVLVLIFVIATVICGLGWLEAHRALEEERLVNHRIKEDAQNVGTSNDTTSETEVETGHQIKRKFYRKPTAETYRNVFDFDINGQRILEDLTNVFCRSTYVRGGQDAERESCYRAGQSSVVNHILAKINQANDPNFNKENLDD